MRAQLLKTTRMFWVISLLSLFVSCQDTIPQRSTITPGSTYAETPTCNEDQDLVSEVVNNETIYSCKDKEVKRPTNAVFWKPDFCACKNGKPVSYGNCSQFCADKNTNGAETLYANFTVSEAISLGGFGNVYAWCKVSLPSDTQNPECQLEAKDETGKVTMVDVILPVNTNSLTANIQDSLVVDKTYVLTLVEKNSGARSDSIQIIKFSENMASTILGPLKNVPITQFSCLFRDDYTEDTATGDIYFENAYRKHYYFVPRIPPDPIVEGNTFIVCHDIFNPLYGLVDQALYPRFEQTPGVFNLWDTTDPRFYDNNGNGSKDVDELIIQKTRNFGGIIPAGISFFNKAQSLAPGDDAKVGNANNTSQGLGYLMSPWSDPSTFRSYCLNSTHYNSNNALFKAMRDVIGVDTEGLYIGFKAPDGNLNTSGAVSIAKRDFIYLREADLKQVWFYLKNGVPTVPTEEIVADVAVYFYYPFNKVSPFVRTSTQKIYRLISAQEYNDLNNGSNSNSGSSLNNNSSNSSGGSTRYPSHDRKIGCIPKF